MSSMLNSFLKITGNEFASIADEGIAAGDVCGWVDTGSYSLNALLSGSIYGGLPGNKVTMIGSEPSTGKTFIALGAAKQFQEANPSGLVFLFESESAISKQMLLDRGIDTKRFGVIPVTTVQEFKNQILKLIDSYEKLSEKDRIPMFFILDSLGNLSTSKEMEDSLSGKDVSDMTRAKMLKATFRVITLKLGRANIPLIVTNHVYDDVTGGPYAGKVQSGGTGARYAASTILTLTKAKEKDSLTNDVIGAIITVTATKSRLTKENQKIKMLIRYDGGLDRYYGLLDIAEEAGVFKKVSTRYELPDGTKVFGKSILNNPEKYYNNTILDQIDSFVKKTFIYTGKFEKEVKEIDDEQE